MPSELDFERYWLDKFSTCLEQNAGETVRQAVMQGSESFSASTDREEIAAWTSTAMQRLEELVDEPTGKRIMTGCACRYPVSELQEIRQTYADTGDLDRVHTMLQQEFEAFLQGTLELEQTMIEEVIKRGWGLAGVLEGDTIIATKIPKSGFLVEYLNESDHVRRRQYYCHCPRVRDMLEYGGTLPQLYCYCGAGFYQGIWEYILQRPVQVEMLESVLDGGEVCKIAIHLGEDK